MFQKSCLSFGQGPQIWIIEQKLCFCFSGEMLLYNMEGAISTFSKQGLNNPKATLLMIHDVRTQFFFQNQRKDPLKTEYWGTLLKKPTTAPKGLKDGLK